MVMSRTDKPPVSFSLAIQDMPYVVLCSGLEHPEKMEEKLSQNDIASNTAKRHQLVCWHVSINANWAFGGVCKVFVCLLGSWLASFGTELLVLTLKTSVRKYAVRDRETYLKL